MAEEVLHNRVRCDGCGESPIRGIRYKCSKCPESYDLCSTCNEKQPAIHDPGHLFLQIRRPLVPVYQTKMLAAENGRMMYSDLRED
jgi:hypothetical protein